MLWPCELLSLGRQGVVRVEGKSEQGETAVVEMPVEQYNQTIASSSTGAMLARSLLHSACRHGHTRVAERLIAVGASVDHTCDNGNTPLFLAAEQGHTSTVELLLNVNARMDLANTSTGASPLYVAAERGHTWIVEMLLAASADINQENSKRVSPLMIAANNGVASANSSVSVL